MKNKKAFELIGSTSPIEMPWEILRFFPENGRKIDIFGEQASLGEDFGTLEELRAAVGWLVDQFGGEVKWKEGK